MPSPSIPDNRRRLEIRYPQADLAEAIHLLGRYRYAKAERLLLPHRHAGVMEICYLYRGRQVYRVGSRDYHLRGGDLFITRPGEVHSTGGRPQEKGVLYWLQVNLRAKADGFLGLKTPQARALLKALTAIQIRHARAPRGLDRLFERIISASLAHEEPLKTLSISHAIIQLLLALTDAAISARPQTPSIDLAELAVRACDEAQTWPTVDDLAMRARLSTSWFKARFRAQTGMGPCEFLMRHRVEQARRMLESGRGNITQIAMRLGFSSSQYFATVVRRFTGHCPGRWLPTTAAGGSRTKRR